MIVNFSNIDFEERPILILKSASGKNIGTLGYAKNISVNLNYNEVSELSFEIAYRSDGQTVPYYDDVVGMRIVELLGIGQFLIMNPTETGDGVYRSKECKCYSLEYEMAYKKITIPDGTYKFWDANNAGDTILGMIMEVMPSWSVKMVSNSLMNRYRTFEVNNENVYNFIKGTIQDTYKCIFDFNTLDRTVTVRDVDDEVSLLPIYISNDNLAKEINVEENVEGIITRLDVNGADGVDIRDVNPNGTNKIIDLSYFMNEKNFRAELIEKYNGWKDLCDQNANAFYLLNVRYAIKTEQYINEGAKLEDLKGEYTSLENMRLVTIEAISQGLAKQEALDEINEQITAKEGEIAAQEAIIEAVQTEKDAIFADITEIRNACNFRNYFTSEEYAELDKYIKDGEVSESTFVAADTGSYTSEPVSSSISNNTMMISGDEMNSVEDASGGTIYEIRGGIAIDESAALEANITHATIEVRTSGDAIISMYLASGTIGGAEFIGACASYTGASVSVSEESGLLTITIASGYRYITSDVSEYQKRSVEWDLYEYGQATLKKLSSPSRSFKISSLNFLSNAEFEAFKNSLSLGQKIYLDAWEDEPLNPICIGIQFEYDDYDSLSLSFSDNYTSSDKTFKLVDLLNQSISAGKSAEISKYVYSEFADSGASTGIKEYMKSALDVARNAIISSGDQAMSWDGAGLRLRKWANDAHTAYENEQIWLANNSILMTDDAWASAKMAIGKFKDPNLGTDCWGIVAQMIMGTMIAGSSLIIESEKKDGGTAVFRVDENGCRLYNASFSVSDVGREIYMDPEIGFVIGKNSVITEEETDEKKIKRINTQNARFWVDADGNCHLNNTYFELTKDNTQIVIDPNIGFVIGEAGCVTDGVLDDEKAKLWIDANGDMNIKGVLKGATGTFSGELSAATGTFSGALNAAKGSFEGEVIATSLKIKSGGEDQTIDEYVEFAVGNASVWRVEINSSNSDVLLDNTSTTLTAKVYRGNTDKTSEYPETCFIWRRSGDDPDADAVWNAAHRGVKSVVVSGGDVRYNAVYYCDVLTDIVDGAVLGECMLGQMKLGYGGN